VQATDYFPKVLASDVADAQGGAGIHLAAMAGNIYSGTLRFSIQYRGQPPSSSNAEAHSVAGSRADRQRRLTTRPATTDLDIVRVVRRRFGGHSPFEDSSSTTRGVATYQHPTTRSR
jgi:hypothetical protein